MSEEGGGHTSGLITVSSAVWTVRRLLCRLLLWDAEGGGALLCLCVVDELH